MIARDAPHGPGAYVRRKEPVRRLCDAKAGKNGGAELLAVIGEAVAITPNRQKARSPTRRRRSVANRGPQRAISEGLARFGRIDTLVNNAGIFVAKPFTQYTEGDYAAMLAVNLTGFFHITQLAVAEMEKQGSGHVVQITTSLVDHAIAEVPSVLASLTKGGLNARLVAARNSSDLACCCRATSNGGPSPSR
jgi:NAD(P)-dependent dehydrogenase (short-subunit alcohol dehydrogenase family)